MNSSLILIFAILALMAYFTREPKQDPTRTFSDFDRHRAYLARRDRVIGLDSEQNLCELARGMIEREKLLRRMRHASELRAPVPRHRALVPIGKVRIRGPRRSRKSAA